MSDEYASPLIGNFPEPLQNKDGEHNRWLANITPNHVSRLAKGISHLAGNASRLSNSILHNFRDNSAREAIAEAVATRVAARIREEDPRYERAVSREAQRLLKEQANLDDITDIASNALGTKTDPDFAAGDLDDDWLYQFEQAAKGFSSERMKHTFGQILAGEILRPGTFSPATLRALTTLSLSEAQLITSFVSMAYTSTLEDLTPQLFTVGFDAGRNGLLPFGLSYENLSRLQQCGFLKHDLTTNRSFNEQLFTEVPGFIGNRIVLFLPVNANAADRRITVDGLLLTSVGTEICRVVQREPPPDAYLAAVRQHFESQHDLRLMMN